MISTVTRRAKHQITFVGGSTNGSSSNASTPIAQPAGTKAGDMGFLITHTKTAVANIPAGWTALYAGIYTKVYSSSEPTIALTWGAGSGYRMGQVYVLRGVRNAMPLLTSSGRTSNSTNTFPANAVTPTENNLWVMSSLMVRMGTGTAFTASITDPGYVSQYFGQAANLALAFGIKPVPQSGLNVATSAGQWVTSLTMQTGNTKLLLLRAA